MNTEQPQKHDDEINPTDIIRSIWDGKWIISGITAVTSIIAVIYLINTPQIYEGALEIFPISSIEVSKYEELNNSKLIEVYHKDASNDPTKKIDNRFIDSKKLELLFIQELLTYKGFEASIMENMYLEKIKDETELDFSSRIKKVARSFSLSKKTDIKSVDNLEQWGSWTVSATTSKPDLAFKVLLDALIFSNNSVKMQVESEIDRILRSHSRVIATRLEDINILSKSLLNDGKLKTEARLAFLNEQTAIAKTLNIKTNTLTGQALSKGSTLSLIHISEPTRPY